MLKHILIGGLLAGLLGGIIVTAIQVVTATPLILEAERYEGMEHEHETASLSGQAAFILVHEHDGPPPAEGLSSERLLTTAAATVAASTGYLLILLAAMWLKGERFTARRTALWAGAGFIVTGLAPSLGLAPELPGSAYVDLADRQIWWIGTVLATAAGLYALVFGRNALLVIGGLVLIALPHVIGAPHAHELTSQVPAELASHFSSTSLVLHALTWLIPATIAGFLIERMAGRDQTVTA